MNTEYERHMTDWTRARVWRAVNIETPPHFHQSLELLYVQEGCVCACVGGRAAQLRAGQLLIVPDNALHSCRSGGDSESLLGVFPLWFMPGSEARLEGRTFAQSVLEGRFAFELRALLMTLAERRTEDEVNDALLNEIGRTTIALLIEHVGLTEGERDEETRWTRAVLSYLTDHCAEPLTVKMVAERFGYSAGRFSGLFRERTGLTMGEALNALRANNAAQILLRLADFDMRGVASQAGFQSLRTFNDAFKKNFGVTPSQYR